MKIELDKIYCMDALEGLKQLDSESIDCVVTSPPYWGLRAYQTEPKVWDGQVDCQHEWGELNKSGDIRYRAGHNCSVGNNKNPNIWARPSRNEFNNISVPKICPVCGKGFNGNHGQRFCSTKCLNMLSNKERMSQGGFSNFCVKCGAWRGELGLEPTPELYVQHLCGIFDEVKRVLKMSGSCWVNLGDTYSGSGGDSGKEGERKGKHGIDSRNSDLTNQPRVTSNLPNKCLCQIPSRFSIEMINRGWILRNTIIWHKPNCMPASVKDRFTVDFEYLFFFVKNKKYYFEQQFEALQDPERLTRRLINPDNERKWLRGEDSTGAFGINPKTAEESRKRMLEQGRNKRCVWTISPRPFKDAHFAVFPEELVETPIKAGCPEFVCRKCGKPREKILEPTEEYAKFLGKSWHDHKHDSERGFGQQVRGFSNRKGNVEGIKRYNVVGLSDCGCDAGFTGGVVLDPFMGSGTTAVVARKLSRRFIGFDISPEYVRMASERVAPLLAQKKLVEMEQ